MLLLLKNTGIENFGIEIEGKPRSEKLIKVLPRLSFNMVKDRSIAKNSSASISFANSFTWIT